MNTNAGEETARLYPATIRAFGVASMQFIRWRRRAWIEGKRASKMALIALLVCSACGPSSLEEPGVVPPDYRQPKDHRGSVPPPSAEFELSRVTGDIDLSSNSALIKPASKACLNRQDLAEELLAHPPKSMIGPLSRVRLIKAIKDRTQLGELSLSLVRMYDSNQDGTLSNLEGAQIASLLYASIEVGDEGNGIESLSIDALVPLLETKFDSVDMDNDQMLSAQENLEFVGLVYPDDAAIYEIYYDLVAELSEQTVF